MSSNGFLIPLAIALFLPFVLRYYMTGTGSHGFLNIHNEFRAYELGKFVGSNVTVLYSDMRIDRYAPSDFRGRRAPAVAIYICRDETSGQHWLWKLYRPTEPDPSLLKLTPEEAEAMLQRGKKLLGTLCPRQRRRPPPKDTTKQPNARNFWDA